ncbi:high mobility group box domain-containing protein [Chlamydoabsidia padenii]|nr:high mobility group box domain-containing protein [Chlamydoabsidia padenii]
MQNLNPATAPKNQKVPRPINCFMAFRLDKYPQVVSQSPGLNHRDISKVISKWWKESSEAEKAPYYAMAAKAKEDHKQRHPGYKYRPVKKSERKVRPYRRKEDPSIRRQKSKAQNEILKKWLGDSEERKEDTGYESTWSSSSSAYSTPASLNEGSWSESNHRLCNCETPPHFESRHFPAVDPQALVCNPIFDDWYAFTDTTLLFMASYPSCFNINTVLPGDIHSEMPLLQGPLYFL